jgi:hypothetical protein
MNPTQRHTPYQHYNLSDYNGNNHNVTYMPELIAMELGMYIVPPEVILTAIFINPVHQ